jgi:hypothetical protein
MAGGIFHSESPRGYYIVVYSDSGLDVIAIRVSNDAYILYRK